MKSITRKQIMDIFCEKLYTNFQTYCSEQQVPEKLDSFTTYLIDQELIDGRTIRQYAIQESFKEVNTTNDLKKTRVVELLANRFNLSTRTIWNILRK